MFESLIQVTSDIHLDQNRFDDYSNILTPSAKYLIIAGDVANVSDSEYSSFLIWCSFRFEKVFLIAGNHEYYNSNATYKYNQNRISINAESMDDKLTILQEKINFSNFYFSNIYFLNQDLVELAEFYIYGCTLWTCIENQMKPVAKRKLNDLKKIFTQGRNGINPLTVQYRNSLHLSDVDFLDFHLSMPHDKPVVIVTHHLPSFCVTPEKYKDGCNDAQLFSNDMDVLLSNWGFNIPLGVWICGHSHGNQQCMIGNWDIHLNPVGVGVENPDYSPQYQLDLNY